MYGPFGSETARHVLDGCFGGIVRGLGLREIYCVAREGGYKNYGATGLCCDHGAGDVLVANEMGEIGKNIPSYRLGA
jgi:hypothetical protein